MFGVAGTFVGFLASLARGIYCPLFRKIPFRILFAVFILITALYFVSLSFFRKPYDSGALRRSVSAMGKLWNGYYYVYNDSMDCVRPGREGTDFTLQTVITHLSSMCIAIGSGKLADQAHIGYQGLFIMEAVLAAVSWFISSGV